MHALNRSSLSLALVSGSLLWSLHSAIAQPVIVRHPENISVSLGANPAFSVTVNTNSLPVTYQWQKDGVPIPGAVNRTLVIQNAQNSSAGLYSVEIFNAGGSIVSDGGSLTVDPTFTKITQGSVVSEPGQASGCSWGDYDKDGWVDLVVARPSFTGATTNLLYRNNGDGTFSQIKTGIIVSDPGSTLSVTWTDYDNDGWLDLFAARGDRALSRLYRNLGDGNFLMITNAPFARQPNNGQAGTWGDFDNDGHLDLFFTGRNDVHNALYQNLGNGEFVRIDHGPLLRLPSSNFRPGVWIDYDNDRDVDLFICNFVGGINFLYRNDGGGNFTSVSGGEAIRDGLGSRGAAWGDYDNDGDMDLFVAHGFGNGNRMFRNDGDGTFTQLGTNILAGFQANSAYAAWGDYDNDGFIDLFVPNGEATREPNAFYRNNGDGTFQRINTGSLATEPGHSVTCGWADYNNDGFLDLFVGNVQNETNFLYRNNGNANHWLKLNLVGRVSNRLGIGATVRVTTATGGITRRQMRQITTGSGHDGGYLIAHFGLGSAQTVETLRIEWPSGQVQEMKNVAADQFLTITEPEANAPFEIRSQPKNQVAGLGKSANFLVTATSGAPVTYQWMKDGQALPGATGPLLRLSNVQRSHLGEYTVVLTSGGTSLSSNPAQLLLDPFTRLENPVSAVGGSRGGAWADYDNDGDLDLLVWNAENVGKVNYLFRNDGAAGFTRLTEPEIANDFSNHFSAIWGDYDNDGDLDLFSANFDGDPNSLFRNDGGGNFFRVGSGSELTDFGGFGGAAWADYDNDGFIDLFFANSLGNPHSLYRNRGDGTFERITSGAIVETGGSSRGAAWSDYDNDGLIDLFVANGNGMNFLFNNLGAGTFINEDRSSIATVDAMGGSWGDYNNDGLMDLFVISPGDRNILFRNGGAGEFSPVTNPGVANEEIVSVGAAFGDYDNDGLIDLFVAGLGRNALFRNTGAGRFETVIDSDVWRVVGTSFSVSWADFDNDGFLDLFVANGGHLASTPNFLFRNNGNTNRWAKFKLVGSASNRAGIGAKIRVKATIRGAEVWQMRELTGGDGFANSQPLEAHFGLGDATVIDTVRIEWPSKKVQELRNVPSNQFLTVIEPGGAPQLGVSGSFEEITLTLRGEEGATYNIEVSTDLRSWTLLNSVTVTSANGTATFKERPGASHAIRFYRAVRP